MNRKGFALVDLLILIVLIAVLVVVFLPMSGFFHDDRPARRASCSSNLKQIYTAMYEYSQDYAGAFPTLPLKCGVIIGEDVARRNLKPGALDDCSTDFSPCDNHSISQNLWLIVQAEFAMSEIFNCPSSEQAGQKAVWQDGPVAGTMAFADFPWKDPAGVISYSFIQPWTDFGHGKGSWNQWRADADSRLVLGADANDGSNPVFDQGDLPVSNNDLKAYVNSRNHTGDGQNLMHGDGHVSWSYTPYAGIGRDNVFSALPAAHTGEAGDTPGILSVRPGNPNDTVLIPNREVDLAKWNRQP